MIRIDRFSPYWKSPETFGIQKLRRAASYDSVYCGIAPRERERLAYFFEFEYADGRVPDEYFRKTAAEISEWRRAYKRKCTLELREQQGVNYVIDTRQSDSTETSLCEYEAALLRVLDVSASSGTAFNRVSAVTGVRSATEFKNTIDRFRQANWLVEEGDYMFSLVLDRNERQRVTDRLVAAELSRFGLSSG